MKLNFKLTHIFNNNNYFESQDSFTDMKEKRMNILSLESKLKMCTGEKKIELGMNQKHADICNM
jgi:hypothetical protein